MQTTGAAIGIIVALDKELHPYLERVVDAAHHQVAGLEIVEGNLDGCRVLLTNAGIGKVNVAIAATLFYDRFKVGLVVFPGLAGGIAPDLAAGDLVVATELIQHDHGNIVDGVLQLTRPSPPPGKPRPGAAFRLAAGLETLAREAAETAAWRGLVPTMRVHFGLVATGDVFVLRSAISERLFREHHALAIEMEGAALAQVADRFGKPCLVLRVVQTAAPIDRHTEAQRLAAAADFVGAVIARWTKPML